MNNDQMKRNMEAIQKDLNKLIEALDDPYLHDNAERALTQLEKQIDEALAAIKTNVESKHNA